MNAIGKIKAAGEVLVDKLIQDEVTRLENINAQYEEFLTQGGASHTFANGISCELSPRVSLQKFICRMFGLELQYRYHETFNNNHHTRKAVGLLILQLEDVVKHKDKFIADIKSANMLKLERALAKYLTPEMQCSEVTSSLGRKGIEVTTIIDGNRPFITNAILAGGEIQCLHYRYLIKFSK